MTTYEQVYEAFLNKARDYQVFELAESTARELLKGYLESAIAEFEDICVQNITETDEENLQFNVALTKKEINILAEGMCKAFLETQRNNSDLFKNGLSTKDYTMFSPANLLNAVQNAYKEATLAFISDMNKYSYSVNTVEDMKKDNVKK